MQDKTNINVKLFVYFIRVKHCIYFLDNLVLPFDLNANFIRYLVLA